MAMATPDEHTEILRLLRENVELSKENQKLIKRNARYNKYSFYAQVLWYALIVGFPFLVYFYVLQPYFEVFGANYEVFREGMSQIPGLKGLENLLPKIGG